MAVQPNINLSAVSYNSTGWSKFTANFILTLLYTHSVAVCAIQEHWLLKPNLYKLKENMPNFEVFAIPAVKNNLTIHSGRPSCGLAIFYDKQLAKFASHIEVPNSKRVHAIQMKLTSGTYVFINCYFPTDPKVNNFDETELHNTLQDINFIFDSCGPNSKYLMMGDVNADFNRNTRFVRIVENYISEKNMRPSWNTFPCDFTHCQAQTRNNIPNLYYSTIDHFFTSENLNEQCVSAMPIHLAENTSNHDPIYIKLSSVRSSKENVPISVKAQSAPKPAWNKAKAADMNSYVNELGNRLSHIEIPMEAVHCRNIHCNDPVHKCESDIYAISIMNCLTKSVENNIPYTSNRVQNITPGWTEHVKPLKDDAKFWHEVWVSAGRPENNSLHHMKKRTRNAYNHAVRRIKNNESALRKDKFVNACLNGNVNDILKDLKHMRQQRSSAEVIDEKTGSANISEHFKDLYSDLYNTHKDEGELQQFRNKLNGNLNDSHNGDITKINSELILKLINKMKSGKNDVDYDWRSDALKNGKTVLAPHLAALLRMFLTHGHVTEVFLKSALVPIVKDNNSSLSSSSNYRAIAISSIIMKLIDNVIMEVEPAAFSTSSYQYGFQSGSSCALCTWVVTETVNYFTSRGSTVYACFLDLKKAFDLVKLPMLFNKLEHRLSPVYLRLMLHCYDKQSCCVRWNHTDSSVFKTSNGVRQGSSASPNMFSVYIDDLFTELENSGLGCYIENQFMGVHGYADDVVLLSPDRRGLQKMVDICSKYCEKHGLKISCDINPKKSKTKCLVFNGKNGIPANITLNNLPVPWDDKYIHLGHRLTSDENMFHDLNSKCGEFYQKVHSLRQELGDQHPIVFIRLVTIYFTSFFGSNLWDLGNSSSNKLWSVWNTLLRSTYNLPYPTHRYVLSALHHGDHLKVKILRRFVNFYKNLVAKSDKPTVKTLMRTQRCDMRSTFGRNCQYIRDLCHVQNIKDAKVNMTFYPVPAGEEWRMPLIKELIGIREGGVGLPILDATEVAMLMDYVCCH